MVVRFETTFVSIWRIWMVQEEVKYSAFMHKTSCSPKVPVKEDYFGWPPSITSTKMVPQFVVPLHLMFISGDGEIIKHPMLDVVFIMFIDGGMRK